MQYETYHFYDDGVEMMIPFDLKEQPSQFGVQNSFVSENRRVVLNVARGKDGMTQAQVELRMDAYYREFEQDVPAFECLKRKKRQFLGESFADLRYRSNMMGYQFYNAFLLGIYDSRELIVTMQSVGNEAAKIERTFDMIAESIRILKKEKSA